MIINRLDGQLRFITQNDHAHFAAELLSLWTADGLRSHPRRRELLFATREHDNGWREADSAPYCDRETGHPHDFMSLPRASRLSIWRRGTARHADREPYAALLIIRHALALHASYDDDPAWTDELAFWRELEAELLETADVMTETVEADYRFLDLADLLSLAACNAWSDSFERHGYRGRLSRGTLEISPFPLAGATTFRIPCRRIPDRHFKGDADLAVELASARWREWEVRVVPG